MHFRRSDRRAVLIIMAFILFFWSGMMVERWLSRSSAPTYTLDEIGMDSLSTPLSVLHPSGPSSTDAAPSANNAPSADGLASAASAFAPETFPFDPNTADSLTLRRLGLADWQVKNIYKYRARGGRFHRTEDFKRVYGMTPEVYERLAPAIRIDRRFRYYEEADFDADNARHNSPRTSHDSLHHNDRQALQAPRYPHQEKFTELVQLDLNTVDTTMLKRVPGIASVRARQIIRLRNRLGGFISPSQLAEIDNFPEELQAWFTADTTAIRRINVNKATFSDLSHHPYIGVTRARVIQDYLRRHGALHDLNELRLLPEFDKETIQRLHFYVTFE